MLSEAKSPRTVQLSVGGHANMTAPLGAISKGGDSPLANKIMNIAEILVLERETESESQ